LSLLVGYSRGNIDWIDMSDYIMVILENGQEVSLDKIDGIAINPTFLKFQTDELKSKNEPILIYLQENHLICDYKLKH